MELSSFLNSFYLPIVQDNRLGATHVSLYMALTREWIRLGGDNPFSIQRGTVMELAKISSRFTYNRCMNELQAYRYINYLPASNSFTQSKVYLRKVEVLLRTIV